MCVFEIPLNLLLPVCVDPDAIPGKTCKAVQKAGGKCYYYGPGEESGEAGEDCWALKAVYSVKGDTPPASPRVVLSPKSKAVASAKQRMVAKVSGLTSHPNL